MVLGRVTLEDVPSIVDALREDVVSHRLVLATEDFEMKTAGPGVPELPIGAGESQPQPGVLVASLLKKP